MSLITSIRIFFFYSGFYNKKFISNNNYYYFFFNFIVLLERVFLRLASVDSDEQLQAALCKFLPPVLLKLSSPQEDVRKKVMELLIHINKRIKSRSQVQLPVKALLIQYQDPEASSFVIVSTYMIVSLITGKKIYISSFFFFN